jgi:HPt (histidine-containing phosphotransfer) domain-containing protein
MDHVDAERIAKLRALEAGLVGELVGLFLETAHERLDEIARATARHDVPLVERLAHNLRGTCATLGMQRLADLLRALEQRAEERQLDDSAPLLDELRRELGVDVGLLRVIAAD